MALYRALEMGLDVDRLLTVHPSEDSYMYHVPETQLSRLAAESLGIDLVEVDPGDLDATDAIDAATQGDAEIEPLAAALDPMVENGQVRGLVAGAIESEFQANRIETLCEEFGIDLFTPLWRRDPERLVKEMLDAGFEITIVQVAAHGLDESWLGRTLDAAAVTDLTALHDRYGIHLLGEGGEFETIVTDGPHMARPIELEYETEWDGTRGRIHVTEASLGGRN